LPRETYGYDSRVHGLPNADDDHRCADEKDIDDGRFDEGDDIIDEPDEEADGGDDEKKEVDEDDEHDEDVDNDEEHGGTPGDDSKSKLDKLLPPTLRSGGKAEKMLQRAGGLAQGKTDKYVVSSWRRVLKSLQRKLRECPAHCNEALRQSILVDDLNEMAPAHGLGDNDSVRHCCDGVFRYFLARELNVEQKQNIEERALTAYLSDQRGYNRLLGDFVSKATRLDIEDNAFHNGTNPSALDDWDAFERLLAVDQQNRESAISTGFDTLDKQIDRLPELTILAGPPGVGKTSLAINIAARQLEKQNDLRVLFLCLEVTKKKLLQKLLSWASGIDYRLLYTPADLTEEQSKSIAAAKELLKRSILPRLRIVTCLNPIRPNLLTKDNLQKLIDLQLSTRGCRQSLVIIDSQQRIELEDDILVDDDNHQHVHRRTESEQDQARMEILAAVQRRTRAYDRPDGCPFIIISQVRKHDERRRLVLADVFGSVDAIHVADCVLLMEPNQGQLKRPGVASTFINVAKIRDTGECGDVILDFHFHTTRFSEPITSASNAQNTVLPAKPSSSRRFSGKI
jgi:replicative DNA helicase